jgi:predicted Zn-dependent peptidase
VSDLAILDRRPSPGRPRDYEFPRFERASLPHGLTVIRAHVPGRPLLQAQLLVRGDSGGGASSERAELAGVTALQARAMSEGTARRDAVALVEAAERLGASLGAVAGWDSLAVHVEVPRPRLAAALALLAEMALEPSFPTREVERLREERLNDLKQAMADPRRRVERLFSGIIYADGAAYARLLGGSEDTVAALDRESLVARHAQQLRPDACTLIVCGDLDGVPVDEVVDVAFGEWGSGLPPAGAAPAMVGPAPDGAAPGRRVVVVDRPGAPQSEIRIGHVGTGRRIDDYHAIVVMNALLGGLFNSRLNRLLREERGYTYGVHSDFEMRRAAGPFVVRCAVETDVTAPAVADIMTELTRIREAEAEPDELVAARDYLVGVFPLRFETSAQVAGALAGLVVHGLPDDELDRYRPTVESVAADAVLTAARDRIDPTRASIAIVGDAARFEGALRDAVGADVTIIRDEGFGDGAEG